MDTGKLVSLIAKLSPKTQKQNTEGLSPPQQVLNNLLGHYQNGRLREAEELSLKITQNFPNHLIRSTPFSYHYKTISSPR